MSKLIGKKQPRPTEKVLARSTGPIKIPTKKDVLCGKGSKAQDHQGNVQYRKIVNQTKSRYVAETKKLKKAFIAQEIVEEIRSVGGRFLKQEYKNCPYYEIGDEAAVKKTKQAIRDAALSETVTIPTEERKPGATETKPNAKSKKKKGQKSNSVMIGNNSPKKISDGSRSKTITSAASSHHSCESHISNKNGNIVWQYACSKVWRDYEKEDSAFLEKEFNRDHPMCQIQKGYVTFQINFKAKTQRNISNGNFCSIRRWNKNTQSIETSPRDVQGHGGAKPSGKVEGILRSDKAPQNKQAVFDMQFCPVVGTRSETSSITVSWLSGVSADSSRRGETVDSRHGDPNQQLPQEQQADFHRNSIAVQQQQHVPTTKQKEVTLPNDLACMQEDLIPAQDEMTLDSGESNLWFKSGHNQGAVVVDSKDATTLDSFDSQIWGGADRNSNAEQQEEGTIAAQDAMTLESFNTQTGNSWCGQSSTFQTSGSKSTDISMPTISAGMEMMSIGSSHGTLSTPES